ncbi:hypothetical protein CDL12_07095 [Handroanthus impetiginosus]|uniref:Uncharacterized protein n=1 Tax=Handroanthus impetiginosus TaxID=429701 RepID=A0A2G9HRP3_9LAMI|nr:hypothetical protein CDL12_07095 [Handroanthus impetiginosus]
MLRFARLWSSFDSIGNFCSVKPTIVSGVADHEVVICIPTWKSDLSGGNHQGVVTHRLVLAKHCGSLCSAFSADDRTAHFL